MDDFQAQSLNSEYEEIDCEENNDLIITDELAKFEILKPANWLLVPTDWVTESKSKMYDEKTAVARLSKHAQEPFFAMMYDHNDECNMCPTVQVTFRVLLNQLGINYEMILHQNITMLSKLFKDFKLIEGSSEYSLAQKPTIYLKSKYSVSSKIGTFACCARSYTIFCTAFAYTVGISGPDSDDHNYEETYDRIRDSIRILI